MKELRNKTRRDQIADTPRVRIDAACEAAAVLCILSSVWSRQSLVHQDYLTGGSLASAQSLQSLLASHSSFLLLSVLPENSSLDNAQQDRIPHPRADKDTHAH